MKPNSSLLYVAWKKLIVAYGLSMVIGLVAGMLLVKIGHIHPEHIFEASTKRLSYALPIFEAGSHYGLDLGILLFVWNLIGAFFTMSFIYTAVLFDPDRRQSPPRRVRTLFCGTARMKLLCHLPGCAKIEAESLRRLYVWVMVPLLGIILLGIESGLQVSTATYIFGSFFSAVIALLPHGLIEIPALALAGAVAYSAHPLIKEPALDNEVRVVFKQIEMHRKAIPIMKIVLFVIGGLFLAGWVEANITQRILEAL